MEYFVDSEAVWMIKRSEAENGKLESWSLHVVERHHEVCWSTPTLTKETNVDLWSFKIFQKITNVFSIIYYILSHCLEYTLILDLERQVSTLLEIFSWTHVSLTLFYLCSLFRLWFCIPWSCLSRPPIRFKGFQRIDKWSEWVVMVYLLLFILIVLNA